MVSLVVKREEGEEPGAGEVNGLIEGSGRREGQRATFVCDCFKVTSTPSETGPLTGKFAAFFLSFFFFFAARLCCLHSLLFTHLMLFPPSHPPSACLAHPSSHCAGLSRWPSLRSALECCFHITASGGMWSLF